MKNKKIYNELTAEFKRVGGDPKFLNSLSSFFTIKDEAKLRAEIRRLKSHTNIVEPSPAVKPSTPLPPKESDNYVGLISDYPVDLHPLYLKRQQKFIAACSLKMQLNDIPAESVESAFKIQLLISKCFDFVNDANKVLRHWREHKRILPTESSEDFSKLNQAQMVQRRNTLRSNVISRTKTIDKIKLQIADAAGHDKLRLSDKLNTKIEQLEQIKLQINQLDKMIKT